MAKKPIPDSRRRRQVWKRRIYSLLFWPVLIIGWPCWMRDED